ncbi:MAG: glycosyltransferase family 39 protein [Acidobacteria bacterium]|nr:glycosyltransferase family 39 protein [Acidobacteriota bacterium]
MASPTPAAARRPRLFIAGPFPLFALIFAAILLPHLALLYLPYFWDEAGYYIPAARDLLLSGSLIPHTTLSNAHPPLVMMWLALWWKVAGFAPVVTRLAMLAIAAAMLGGVYRLAAVLANREVAIASTICTAVFPPVFAQSTLAHLDMAAAAFTFWGLLFYFERRTPAMVMAFSLAALSKETAVIAPVALFAWEMVCPALELRTRRRLCAVPRAGWRESLPLLIPGAPLACWFTFHWWHTGVVLGNPGFFQANVAQTLSIPRAFFALAQRMWQLMGYLNMYVLTLGAAAAMFLPPLPEGTHGSRAPRDNPLRQRISVPAQLALAAVIAAYLALLSLVGGALLARYLLPVFPLWILLCVSTLRRRVRLWPAMVAIVALAFVLALLYPPPYRIAPEDTLAYRDFIQLHQAAARRLEMAEIARPVLTAWPASDELQRPFLGYVRKPLQVIAVEDFSRQQIEAARLTSDWSLALIFSTKYEPPGGSVLDGIAFWRRAHQRWFGYHRDLAPEQAARILQARVLWSEHRGPQWVAILAR